MLPDDSSPQTSVADPGTARRLVLVAGAGRSGTSTVAGILQRLGLVVVGQGVIREYPLQDALPMFAQAWRVEERREAVVAVKGAPPIDYTSHE